VGWVLLILLALVVGIATFQRLERRHQGKFQTRERAVAITSHNDFVRALIRRDSLILAPLANAEYGDPPAALEKLAAAVQSPAAALGIGLDQGWIIVVAPGPEPGPDQIDEWLAGLSGRSAEPDLLEVLVLNGIFCLADYDPDLPAELADLCFSCQSGSFILLFGKQQAVARLRLANPGFSYQLRPNPDQRVILCAGDQLLDPADNRILTLDPLPAAKSTTRAAGRKNET
jgi:hypothetical protein